MTDSEQLRERQAVALERMADLLDEFVGELAVRLDALIDAVEKTGGASDE